MGQPEEAGDYQHEEIPATYENQPQEDPQNQPPPPQQQQFQQQQQQQFQPQQQQKQQYPPAQPNNQGYWAQPAQQPMQHAPHSPINNPAYSHQPFAGYTPQAPPMKAAQFPPQPNQMQQQGPVSYPPQNQHQMMGQAHQSYPPQPVSFPPPPPQSGQGVYVGMAPPSPYKQPVQGVYPGAPVPAPHFPPQPQFGGGLGANGAWQSGLFDCMDDPTNAAITCLFPCVTFGQIAEIIDNGNTSCATSGLIYGCILALIYVPCIMSCTYRTKLRNKYGLPEAPAPDWITHFIFETCALCQEYRELQRRGIDPALGWHGNVARMQQQTMMTPPTNQTMMG